MKYFYVLLALTWVACNKSNERQNEATAPEDTVAVQPAPTQAIETEETTVPLPEAKVYSNERFKEVTVETIGEHVFLIQGKGQIFEARFGWVVEDGHQELKKGAEMTDAGAPEWGQFKFTINVEKERANSTLMLILFESSPKDGSRQYELPVFLY